MSQEPDPFADFRATPDKVWGTLLNIHGELRDIKTGQTRLESALLGLKRSVQIGIVVGLIIAALALLRF